MQKNKNPEVVFIKEGQSQQIIIVVQVVFI